MITNDITELGFAFVEPEPDPAPYRPPQRVCCCRNDGQPYLLNGVAVVSRSPACRVHADKPELRHVAQVAENYGPSFMKGREKAQ